MISRHDGAVYLLIVNEIEVEVEVRVDVEESGDGVGAKIKHDREPVTT